MTNPQKVKETQPTSIPFAGIRKIIAERLTKSHLSAPHVTLMREIDATSLRKLREKLVGEIKSTRISYTDILVRATTEALKAYRIVNSRLERDQIRLLDQINIGIAVAQESGLIVPVIRNLERKSLVEVSTELASLVAKASKGALTLNEVTGGTFTITNLGMFGVDAFTPIINPPESAVLGVGRIIEKPMVVEGRIEARSVMTLSLTFDHRVLDGAVAAQFLRRLAQILEKPEETTFFAA
jgi:pyruvate dehydrogenase E2 component (dihydrolipoamide acetyltransferase)